MSRAARRTTPVVVLLVSLLAPASAMAGPPVLWHPLDIGTAASLPWGNSGNWWSGEDGYDLRQLVLQTDILLKGSRPLIVRMETLRRAAVYASQDTTVARELFTRFRDRVTPVDNSTLFDFVYLRAVLQSIAMLTHEPQFRARALAVQQIPGLLEKDDGMERIAALWPDDPAVAFACALIASSTSSNRERYQAYVARAKQGVKRDALLAMNIDHLH